MIVEDHDLIIAGQADVALDTGADFQRRSKGGKTILGNAGTVEPAMREPHYPWVKRVRL
jgi:hypothetical protein